MAEYILEARDVEFTYPDGTEALRRVSAAIPKGQKVAFLGSNGSGKSTLFLHFNGILRAKRGKILFAGKDISYDRSSLMELRKNVGIVFQDPDIQLFSASVLQEISFGPMNLGLSKEKVLERVHAAMAATGVTELKDKPTHFLSYGQKKRVSIADILAMEPSALICDEPTAWLDPQHTIQLLQLFDRISQSGTTVVMSTHDVDAAYSWADYIFVMHAGRVIGAGTPEEVFQNDGLLRQADLARPWLVEVYAEMRNKGWLVNGAPVPRTKAELFACIPTTLAKGVG